MKLGDRQIPVTNDILKLRRPSATIAKTHTAAELEKARADSAAARQRAEKAEAKLLKSTRDAKLRLRVTAAIMMTAALAKLTWAALEPAQPPASIAQPMPAIAATTPSVATTAPTTASRTSTPAAARPARAEIAAAAAANVSLERLRDAFHSFPDEDQPAVVQEVNARYAGACPLAWNDGTPVLFVSEEGDSAMLASALSRCAAGVERLRRETDALPGTL